VVVENDATAAAVYEARRRLRESTDSGWNDFVLVRAGTGIGVGLVRGGEVYRGTGAGGGLAGEFGHMTIVAGGKPCACGNRGCWERYASATSAAALYTGDRQTIGSFSSVPSFVEVVARAEAGERRAQATLEGVGEYLGIGIANVISGLGVARVVVSGRIVYGWKYLEGSLRQAVRRTMAGRLARWSVEAGEARGAGFGGALEVAVEQYLTKLAAQSKAK
jgi:glucokinase